MSDKQTVTEPDEVLTHRIPEDETPSRGVVAAVAAVSDTDPTEMDPLGAAIDPDALDGLFADRYDGTGRPGGTARFSFLGYEVVVTGDGYVTVLDADS